MVEQVTISRRNAARIAGYSVAALGVYGGIDVMVNPLPAEWPMLIQVARNVLEGSTAGGLLVTGLVDVVRGRQFELPLRIWRGLTRSETTRQEITETLEREESRRDQRMLTPIPSSILFWRNHNQAA